MMARRRQRPAPERRCILCRESGPRETMIRLVAGPDGALVPDLRARLPGRGLWVHADRAAFAAALRKGHFARAAARALRAPVGVDQVPPDLADRLEHLLAAQVLAHLGLACRAGRLVTGFEKVLARLKKDRVAVLVAASDAAPDGRRKLHAHAGPGVRLLDLFDRTQLGLALGRENVVHAAIERGGATPGLMRDLRRLAAWHGRSCVDRKAARDDADEWNGNSVRGPALVPHNEESV